MSYIVRSPYVKSSATDHAGCQICVAAEQPPANAIDPAPVHREVVHPAASASAIDCLGAQNLCR